MFHYVIYLIEGEIIGFVVRDSHSFPRALLYQDIRSFTVVFTSPLILKDAIIT